MAVWRKGRACSALAAVSAAKSGEPERTRAAPNIRCFADRDIAEPPSENKQETFRSNVSEVLRNPKFASIGRRYQRTGNSNANRDRWLRSKKLRELEGLRVQEFKSSRVQE